MIYSKEIARKTAELLLQIKAVKINTSSPFIWASGIVSPIYCDNRITLSFPAIRTFIRQQMGNIIREEFDTVEAIAGVATAGIPHGVLVAQELGLPFAYVRSEIKDHGLKNSVEGLIHSGQNVVMVEDLISTGGSSLNAIRIVRENGGLVKGLVAIFSYNFSSADDNFKAADCRVITLTDFYTLLEQALQSNYIKEGDFQMLKEWHNDPVNWKNEGKIQTNG